MTIYQVVYYNRFGERVADFGYYEDKLDAEQRAFDIRIKTSLESGTVNVEEIFVYESSQKPSKKDNSNSTTAKKKRNGYNLKDHLNRKR